MKSLVKFQLEREFAHKISRIIKMKRTLEITKCLCFDDRMEALSIKYRKFSTTESIIMHDGEENSAFYVDFMG